MRRVMGGVVAVAAASMVLTACGGSSGGGGGGSAAPASSSSSSSGQSGALKLDRPLKIGILFEKPGESQVAVADYPNAGELGVKDLNDHGGVGGKQVEMKRMPVSALDPQKAASDFLAMVDWGPDVIVGFPSSTIDAVIPQIERAGIPVLTPVEDENTLKGSNSGSQWLWILPPLVTSIPARAADYVVQDVKATKIAQLSTNETYGNNSSAAFSAELARLGAPKVVSDQKISPTATDLTSQVLGMKGADFLAAWIYPNEFGVLEKQLNQNGVKIPVIGSGSAELAIGFGTVKPGQTAGDFYASIACNPTGAQPGSALDAMVKQYKAAYPSAAVPFSQAVSVYDGVHIAAKAVELAGSLDKSKINAAIPQVQYTGACGDYKADGAHVLGHDLQIVQFTANGAKTVKEYTNDPLASRDDLKK